ncbi:MAG: hypothetical protein WC843_06675 [Candidatus Gracilibacteria bacterium]|jgi:hypothetical protein
MAKKIILFIILYFIYVPLLMFLGGPLLVGITSNWLIIFPIFIVLMVVPFIVFFATYNRPSKKQRQLLLNGKDAQAVVTKVEDTGVTVNGIYFNLRLSLQIKPKDGQSFEAKTESLFSRVNLPRPGDVFAVKYDPNDKSEVMLHNAATVQKAA